MSKLTSPPKPPSKSPLQLAQQYMEIFYGRQQPLDKLRDLLGDPFSFSGPFFATHSADDYVNNLLENPPVDFSYEIIAAYENTHSAVLIYTFSKPGVFTPMAQQFQVENNKITKILLIFDTAHFK